MCILPNLVLCQYRHVPFSGPIFPHHVPLSVQVFKRMLLLNNTRTEAAKVSFNMWMLIHSISFAFGISKCNQFAKISRRDVYSIGDYLAN